MNFLLNLLIVCCLEKITALPEGLTANEHYLLGVVKPLGAILESTVQSDCSAIFVVDDSTSPYVANIAKELDLEEAHSGFAVIHMAGAAQDTNTTDEIISNLIAVARKLRKMSWCVVVVLFSEDPSFLGSFAEHSLKGRFLVWTSRLIIVTRFYPLYVSHLLQLYWTFSMMNTMILNVEETLAFRSWSVYVYLPYSSEGAGDVKVASWTKTKGLLLTKNASLFPDKYTNFYGAVVNVTSLPYPPYWIEEEYTKEDGTQGKRISGTDGLLLHVVAQSLNFTIYNIPTKSWGEVVDRVVARESFISPVLWTILPERLARFDMTYVYEWSFMAFCMAKPPLTPNWQSLRYPLAIEVWFSIFMCILVVPVILFAISYVNGKSTDSKVVSFEIAFMEILGTLFGENCTTHLPETDSARILMVAWLFFTFIIQSAYQGNLTANLTLPKYPPRPETVEEVVKAVDIVTGASYISYFKEFFSKSDYPPFKKFADLMVIGLNAPEGMQQALQNRRSALMDIPRYMRHVIAEKFTRPDGSTELYIGRSSLLPGQAGWPVPHDAPFKSNLDKSMQAVIEAGLYEKWSSDLIDKARRDSIRRQEKYLKSEEAALPEEINAGGGSGDRTMALTINHMIGPLIVFIAGLILGLLSFTIEQFVFKWTLSAL